MQRIPEVELMEDEEQALAYARADFEEPHAMFIRLFGELFDGQEIAGRVLDLGCGTADITMRFVEAYPQCHLDGIDGSESMLRHGHESVTRRGLAGQINLIHGYLPGVLLGHRYDAAISNSLLHHMQDPMVLWDTIKQFTKPGAPVFVMDLLRPVDKGQAKALVEENTGNEPDILKRDFYNSLLAAYSTHEVKDQLDRAALGHLSIKVVSDRHFVVSGYL